MKKLIIIACCLIRLHDGIMAQTLTQNVRGRITDQVTQEELFGATIAVIGSDPIVGTTSGPDGTFQLTEVPLGRQSFEFRMMGYETQVVSEVLVTSAKEVVLDIKFKHQVTNLEELVVTYEAHREQPINEMATVSSRQFTVEETQRYAGGLNDPARLVSAFAGVASPGVSSNGISVRGNSPSGLLWRIEGVEVPSPNHFADLTIAGAGALTVLSSQVLGNSDFYTGAFPAEYGNASSGVFDINLRSGNAAQREHTVQAGILGVEFATEGPFKKGHDATYLLNYRYSTFGLVAPLLPTDAGILKYQDLSYKINLPTDGKGKFSLWGVGAHDAIDTEALDSVEWESNFDREDSQTSMYLFASGIDHQINVGPSHSLRSTLAFSGNGLSFEEQYRDDNLQPIPQSNIEQDNYRATVQSTLTSYLSDRHFNRTGFYANYLGYNLAIDDAEPIGSTPSNIVDETGQSVLLQLYTQSQFDLTDQLTLNAGVHSQYFHLNENFTFEPRLALNYQLGDRSDLALAYGTHTRVEPLPIYFVKDDAGNELHRELDLMRSSHIVLSFSTLLGEHTKLTIEPYYQYLNDVPVSPDSYISTLNIDNNLFFNEALTNNGKGTNLGVDLTLERYLHNGFYYLLSASVFDSKYIASDGIERNTRYNKNLVGNAVVGKEWQVGRGDNNTLSVNLRFNYLGGNRIEAIDEVRSIQSQEVVYGETDGRRSFAQKHQATPISSFTVSHRKNKRKHSSVWSLQVLNAGSTEEFDRHIFNTRTQRVEEENTVIVIPNLSYKIEF